MYNSKIICTYNYYDPSLRETNPEFKIDLSQCEDLEDMAEFLYQDELLHVFNVTKYDETIINGIINELYHKLNFHTDLKQCMTILANNILSEDLEFGFMVLFSYNYFFLTHRCICDFLETGDISIKNIIALKNVVK